jgi:transposase
MNSNGTYSETLKKKLLARMLGPHAISATGLSREVGISQATLSRWLRDAGTVAAVVSEKKDEGEPVAERTRRRSQDWTPDEKLRAVVESMKLADAELGAFLRREGLHEAQLCEWREAALEALEQPVAGKRRKKEAKRVRELEKELRRKEKALAEAAALIVLEKKLQTLWGAEDDDTDEENET